MVWKLWEIERNGVVAAAALVWILSWPLEIAR